MAGIYVDKFQVYTHSTRTAHSRFRLAPPYCKLSYYTTNTHLNGQKIASSGNDKETSRARAPPL